MCRTVFASLAHLYLKFVYHWFFMSYVGDSRRQLASAQHSQSSFFFPPGPGSSAVLFGSQLEQERLHVTDIVSTLLSA